MKEQGNCVSVAVRLRDEVFDPAGNELLRVIRSAGIREVRGIRINKLVEVEFSPGADTETVESVLEQLRSDILVNPVVEESRII